MTGKLPQTFEELVTGVMEKVKDKLPQILEASRLNDEKLASCAKPHLFQPPPGPRSTSTLSRLEEKWYCARCGGYVRHPEAIWYGEGVKDALRTVVPKKP